MDNNKQNEYPIVHINGKEYLKICPSDRIYEGKGKQIKYDDDLDKQVAIFRVGGKLYCLWNICPHRHQDQIHNGIIKDRTVTCPVHGWSYFLESGENTNPRQGTKKLDKFEVIEIDGYVYIEKPIIEIPLWRKI